MHSIFSGSPGTGKTTVAHLLGRALYKDGDIKNNVFVEKQPGEFLNGHDTPKLTHSILESARGGVLFIDEAYGFYKENNNEFAEEALNQILAFMENNRDDIVVIFAGYATEMQKLLAMNPGLESRIPNQFIFENYSPSEIAEIGYRALLDDDYVVNEELYRTVVSAQYAQAVTDGNARWVREFNSKLIAVMVDRVFTEDSDDVQTIAEEDLYNITGGDEESKNEAVAQLISQLDAMVGLEPVKTFVKDLVTEVQYDKLNSSTGTVSNPGYHTVFTGNPGTGKTTVAEIIAQLFYNLGILQKPIVKQVQRPDLVAGYIGQTEPKTMQVLQEAMGGVLFVDEAYQLTNGVSANDFGRQAVETMLVPLEESRDKFIAIFDGYTEDMNEFLSANPGLRSRVPKTIEFPD